MKEDWLDGGVTKGAPQANLVTLNKDPIGDSLSHTESTTIH